MSDDYMATHQIDPLTLICRVCFINVRQIDLHKISCPDRPPGTTSGTLEILGWKEAGKG